MRTLTRLVAPLAGLFSCVGAAAALTPLGTLRYAPDITVDLSGTTVDHNEVAEDNLAGLVTLVNVGAIPSTAIVTAYDVLDSGVQLRSFDIDLALPGGLTVRPGDVVSYDGATFSLLFDAAANGIPRGVITDAVASIGPMDLLLSFDITVAVGTITAIDRDVVRFHDGVFSLFFDGTAAGVPNGMWGGIGGDVAKKLSSAAGSTGESPSPGLPSLLPSQFSRLNRNVNLTS